MVVPTLEEAGRWAALLELMGWNSASLYPTSEGSPYEPFDPTSEIVWGQLQVLSDLIGSSDGADFAIVATERALQPHLPPPEALTSTCRTLRRGDEIDLEDLGETLAQLGYERVSTIDQEGTWSRRGDIVDVFPVSSELPVRLEFFGEELDKLREFDPATQRSLDPIDQLRLTPTGFSPLIADQLRESMPEGLDRLLSEQALDELLEGSTPEGMRRLMGLAWQQPASLLDYLPSTTTVVVDERRQGLAHGQQWLDHVDEHHHEMAAECGLSDAERDQLWPAVMHRPIAEAYDSVETFHGFDLAELLEEDSHTNSFDLASRPVPAYPNQFGKLGELIKRWQTDRTAVWLVSAQPSRAVALLESTTASAASFQQRRSTGDRASDRTEHPCGAESQGHQELEGCSFRLAVALITDQEFFGQQTLSSSGYVRRAWPPAGRWIQQDATGDFVVHRNHGIGRPRRWKSWPSAATSATTSS